MALPLAPEQSLRKAADWIAGARRPLIMIGAAANRCQLVPELSAFVRRVRIPFFNTQMGKGAVDGNSDLYLGTAALSEHDYIHLAIREADLIVAIGHDVVEKPPFLMGPMGPHVIHIGFHSASVQEVYFPQHEVIGEVGASLRRLSELLAHKPSQEISRFLELRDLIHERVAQGSQDERFPPTPQRIVREVRRALPDDGILSLDNGMYKIWFARGYRTHVANTILLDNALATMGAGLPGAMTAALLHPDRKVMAVCGDGGFMMNSQELETAVRLKLNLVVLIIEDRGYGMIRWKQAAAGFPDYGLTFGNPDFVKYAEAYGARGVRVDSTEELLPALHRALEQGGVQLVCVPVDYSENQRVLVDELARLQ
jgi:acetolactate synthase-1/2/3 large subunit